MSEHFGSSRSSAQPLVSASAKTPGSLLSLSLLVLALFCFPVKRLWAQTPTPVLVPTWRYDLTHSGSNTTETLLTPANVNVNTFGKLFSLAVDGLTYAQPLYVPGLTMSDGLVHNVLFVATSHNSVYAFDADSNGGANANPIWHIDLLTPAYGAAAGETTVPWQDNNSPDVGENGVTGTPAINPATNTMYLVATSTLNGVYYSRLHAINLITGAEQANGPALISATVPGTGNGSTGGQLSFNPLIQNQRTALNYYNGYVYFGYAAHGDIGNWHGWLFSYNATTLQQTAVLCLSPNGFGAGIWESGAGMPIDSGGPGGSGRMFVAVGNGTFGTANTPTAELGESIVQFNLANGGITPSDIFVAFNAETLNTGDVDLGSGGILMLPDELGSYPHELVEVGKEGRIDVLNRDALGGFAGATATSNTNALQDITGVLELPAGAPTTKPPGLWNTPAYWHGHVYLWGNENVPMMFSMDNGVLSTTPTSQSTITSHFPTPSFSISANDLQDGIAWALRNDQFNTDGPAVLYAWDATDLTNLLYESDTNAQRDSAGPANKNAIPIVTNGKVYVATHGQVDVYGLFNGAPNAVAPVITPNGGTFSATQNVTLTSTTTTASIYFTLDGSVPTPASTLYTGPISISGDITLNAIASAPGFVQSGVSSATFTFTSEAPPVTFQPPAGTYNSAQQVTLADTDTAATIYYTTDGSTPTAASEVYTGPIPVAFSLTINAIAIDPKLTNSDIATAAYVIQAGGTEISFPDGFSTPTGLTFNGTTAVDDTRLQLTDGNLEEAGSVFWNTPINVQAFTTNFAFQLSSPTPTQMGNGFTFTIQNNSPTALGGDSAGLGYQGIPKSVAIKFNFYNYENEGSDSTGLYTDGEPPVNPTVDISSSGVILNSGDNINAQITYDGTTLTLTLADPLVNKTFTYSWPINITQFVGGNTAYVGFTGGAGGLSASQKLLSWTYVTQALPPVFSVAAGTYTTVQNATLTSATPDATIYYTTNGTTPNGGSTVYTGPIAVGASETIQAVAISPTVGTSMVESAAYVINLQTETGTFSLSGTSPATIMQGGTATSTITVAPSGGFTGNVTLSCAVTPAGATGAPTCAVTQPAAITGTGSAMAALTFTTQATTSPGTYTVTVTGTSASLIETTTVPVLVSSPTVTPSFTLSGTSVSVTAGTNGTSTITVAPTGGFLGSVALACAVTGPAGASNLPTCSAAQPAAISGTKSVTAALTVSTQAATTAGSYTVTVTGTSASLKQTATVAVTVTAAVPPPTPGFALTGASITNAVPGTPATSTITITPSGGFAGTVALACSLTSSPTGAGELPTCSVTQPVAISGTSAVTATLTVSMTGSSTAAMHNPLPRIFGLGGGTMAVVALFGVPFRRRKWQTMLGLVLLCAAFMGVTGCGGGSSSGASTNSGTTAGAYVVTVTGTSGTITQTAQVAVTVQ
jgi:hypothetical protein